MNKIFVDKGDKVRQGQLLATIVSPETDQSYRAAVADLDNKTKIAKRDQTLVQKDYISKEDAEASSTAVAMAEAQVQSLKEQMNYKNIIAPFCRYHHRAFCRPGRPGAKRNRLANERAAYCNPFRARQDTHICICSPG